MLGESGSGKSVTAQAIMGILDTPPGFVTGGEVFFKGEDLLKLSDEERRKLRGENIAMIFQDALSSLNPVFTVGWQIAELFRIHRGMGRKEATSEAVDADANGSSIPAAGERIEDYPHQFSGGMRQRIMIAMAMALRPRRPDRRRADDRPGRHRAGADPRPARRAAGEYEMGLILITHDLGVVAEVADKVAVMYAGRIVEQADDRRDVRQSGAPVHASGCSSRSRRWTSRVRRAARRSRGCRRA